jgi:pilus assembly protein CpaC
VNPWQKKRSSAVIIACLYSVANVGVAQTTQAQPAPAQTAPAQTAPADAPEQESPHDLTVGVGKSVIVSSGQAIERVSVGFGDFAEATVVSPQEVLVNGKTPGETSLIIWQVNGPKLFFELTVLPSTLANTTRMEALRRQLKQELPGQNLSPSIENDSVFLRGTVKDLTSANRAVAIAGTFGKTVNLLYVSVPATEQQILLKVQFATIDRSISNQLGLNIASTGATNTVGTVTTQQFSPPTITQNPTSGTNTLSLSNALNIFLLRPDLNLAATIQALEQKSLVQVLAEPNVLAINGKQASFLAGGEFPYPVLQGSSTGSGTAAITVQFREFGVRLNFIPNITPRGTILLDVAPEVSALDFSQGLTLQGFTIPAITSRKVRTEVELRPGQSFAIGGLLDRQLTETLEKIPLLGDIPLLGKLFHSRSINRQNTELLVIVTPELVQPIPVEQQPPALKFPKEFLKVDSPGQTHNPGDTGTATVRPAVASMPFEKLIESMKTPELNSQEGNSGATGLTQPSSQAATPTPPITSPAAK